MTGVGGEAASNTLTFGHAGRLKLAKPPTLSPPGDGALASVQLVGESETMNLGALLGDLEAAGEPIVQLLEVLQGAAVDQEIEIPLGSLLQQLGVPAELTAGAPAALNPFLALQGETSIGASSSTITFPVDLPPRATVAAAGAVPTGGALSAPGEPAVRTINIAKAGAETMQLISEVHWDKLTGGLLEAAGTGNAAPSFAGIRLVGDVTIDLGCGPVTGPLSVPLAAPVTE